MSLKTLESIITPIQFKAGRLVVTLHEVVKLEPVPNDVRYLVVLSFQDRDYLSRPFFLVVRNTSELKHKLMAEITKYRLHRIVLGPDVTRRLTGRRFMWIGH